ncbi:UNVERIFIED_CONTAM: hypothetical protein HDU68_003197 [Siphonaria sp. JEL0065]|nr:hypothetical protein HDU68_003197 [Siphonaria sp. JEL0065]
MDAKDLVVLGRKRLEKYKKKQQTGTTTSQEGRVSLDSIYAASLAGDDVSPVDRHIPPSTPTAQPLPLPSSQQESQHEIDIATLADHVDQLRAELAEAELRSQDDHHNLIALQTENHALKQQLLSNASTASKNNNTHTEKLAYQTALIEQLERELDQAKKQHITSTVAATLDRDHAHLESLNSLVTDLQSQLATKNETVETLFAELQDTKALLAQTQQLLSAKEVEAASLLADNESFADQVESALVTANTAAADAIAARRETDALKLKLENLVHEKSNVFEQEMVVHKAALKEKSESLSNLTRSMEMTKFDLGNAAEKLNHAEKRVSDLLVDNKALMDQLAELRQSQITLQNEKIALVIDLNGADQSISKLSGEIQSLEALKEEARVLKELIRKGNLVATPTVSNPSPSIPPPSFEASNPVKESATTQTLPSPTTTSITPVTPTIHTATTTTAPETTPNQLPNPLLPELESLKKEIQQTRQALAEERHRTELLAMELECIPDYIQLYHNERKMLITKATTGPTTPNIANAASPVRAGSGVPLKVPRAIKNVLGVDRSVACGPCADCDSRVFVL